MSDLSSESPSSAPILASKRGRLGHIVLNRPRAINALTTEMIAILSRVLSEWADDDQVETVLLTGAGERGLCAGGDIVSLYRDAVAGADGGDTPNSETFWREEYLLNAAIANYPKPYVAIQDGVVLGGGIGVSAHGSIRVVTERSKLGMPETGIGFVPDVGGTYLLSRAPGELGTHLALTGSSVGAADAILLGLSDHFVSSDRLPALIRAFETEDAESAVKSVATEPPAGILADARAWIDEAYAADDVGQILDRLSQSDWDDAHAAAEVIRSKSPLALVATLASLRRAKRLPDLEAVLEQEFRVSLNMLR